jgi:hypothetical protein
MTGICRVIVGASGSIERTGRAGMAARTASTR